MGAAAHQPCRPVCGAVGCREAVSVELPFCRAHWRALPAATRRTIVRQWRIGYGTGAEAASFQTTAAVRAAREIFKSAAPPTQPPPGAARKLLAESQAITRAARDIEAASADLLRRAELAAGRII